MLARLLKDMMGTLRRAGRDEKDRADATSAADAAGCYDAGLRCLESGQIDDARLALERAIELRPELAEAHFALGLAWARNSNLRRAEDCYRLAVRFRPEYTDAHLALGSLAHQRGDLGAAAGHYANAIAAKPDFAEAHCLLAGILIERGEIDAARACLQQAVAAQPGLALAHNNLANLLFVHYDDVEGALHHVREALAIDPEFLAAQLNHAMVKQFSGRCEEAIAIAQKILARDPGNDKARFASGLAYLMMGDYQHGWPAFEARKTSDSRSYIPRVLDYPDWDGSPLRGRTLLVHAEQGLGDEIMFASCLPELIAAADHCVIDCHEKLQNLFRRSFPGATVHGAPQMETDMSWLSQVPQIDCKVACGTVPLFLRRHAEDFPRHAGYLRADPNRVEYWRGRLRDLGPGRKIGLSWRGGSKHTHRSIRSLDLDQLAPLVRTPGAHFVSLQYTDCRQEIDQFSAAHGLTVHSWQEAIDDYDETAALVCALDLVISVQTALVHLTGALGRPAWVMVSAASEWRYQRSGESVPWYPSVRILRQAELRRWQPVIERVAQELRELTGGHGAAPDALLGQGIALARSRDYGKAQTVLDQLTAQHPDFLDGLNARANLERLQGNWGAAESWYRRALAVNPGSAAVLANLGGCLKDAGRLEEARHALERASELAPADLDVRLNYATALVDCGDWNAAATQLREILELQPDMAEAHTSLGHILLAHGEFAPGWEEYEWRYLCQDAKQQLPYPYPAWDGTPLASPLVIRAEQGLGDQIMFASCIPDLQARAPRCILECDPRLVPIFVRAFPEVNVCGKRPDNPDVWARAGNAPGAQLFLSSLPRLVRRSAADFPVHRGYLRADPEKVRKWQARLEAIGPGVKVGLSWRGGAPQTRQSLRSIPLPDFAAVLRAGQARFVSLQYGRCEDEIAALRSATGLELHHWPEAIEDYDETAGLVTALDLVISVQTAVVHLAGALGKPAWVLVPAAPEWRYMAEGDSMPWYPTVRLFRQQALLEWKPVLTRIAAALAAWGPAQHRV